MLPVLPLFWTWPVDNSASESEAQNWKWDFHRFAWFHLHVQLLYPHLPGEQFSLIYFITINYTTIIWHLQIQSYVLSMFCVLLLSGLTVLSFEGFILLFNFLYHLNAYRVLFSIFHQCYKLFLRNVLMLSVLFLL